MPLVSVIVTNFRDTNMLDQCLSSLVNTQYPRFEVIVVDCLTRGICEWTAEKFRTVRVIHFSSDIGPAASKNAGAADAASQATILAFLDNDIVVDPGWLTSLVKALDSDGRIGAVQAGAVGETTDHTCNTTTKKIVMPLQKETGGHGEIFSPVASAMAVRRDVFQLVRGFDDAYFIFHDDLDLGWRIRLAGFRVVTAPNSIARSVGNTPAPDSRRVYFSYRNAIRTLLKNYDRRNAFLCVISRLTQDLGHFLACMISGRPQVGIVLAKAACWNLWQFPSTWRERLRVQAIRRVPDTELQRLMISRTWIQGIAWMILRGLSVLKTRCRRTPLGSWP
jgi:hypothetical protein